MKTSETCKAHWPKGTRVFTRYLPYLGNSQNPRHGTVVGYCEESSYASNTAFVRVSWDDLKPTTAGIADTLFLFRSDDVDPRKGVRSMPGPEERALIPPSVKLGRDVRVAIDQARHAGVTDHDIGQVVENIFRERGYQARIC